MSRRLEIGALLALCFFLPLYEAPKSIFWALYIIVWVVNRVRSQDWGGRWDRWDSLLAAWLASGFVVATFAGLHDSEWRGAVDLLRCGAMAWIVRRSRYEAREIRLVLAMLVFSAVVGLAWAYANLWRGAASTLQLNSVGHVNHTAIYLAMVLGITWAWTFASWRGWSPGMRLFAAAIDALLITSLVVTASRGALAGGLAVLIVIAAFWRRGARRPVAEIAVALIFICAVLFAGGAAVLQKYERIAHAADPLGLRHAIWRSSLAAWERHPWFGIGIDNFSLITLDRLQRWHEQTGKPFDSKLYDISPYGPSHGHSLYFTALAERGLVGVAPLVLLIVAWFVAISRRPRPEDGDDRWLAWGAATGAWVITAGIGMVNTTLHHEHGILAMLLLGAWLAREPER